MRVWGHWGWWVHAAAAVEGLGFKPQRLCRAVTGRRATWSRSAVASRPGSAEQEGAAVAEVYIPVPGCFGGHQPLHTARPLAEAWSFTQATGSGSASWATPVSPSKPSVSSMPHRGPTDHPYYNLASAAGPSTGPPRNYGQHACQPERPRIAANENEDWILYRRLADTYVSLASVMAAGR